MKGPKSEHLKHNLVPFFSQREKLIKQNSATLPSHCLQYIKPDLEIISEDAKN